MGMTTIRVARHLAHVAVATLRRTHLDPVHTTQNAVTQLRRVYSRLRHGHMLPGGVQFASGRRMSDAMNTVSCDFWEEYRRVMSRTWVAHSGNDCIGDTLAIQEARSRLVTNMGEVMYIHRGETFC